MWIVAVLVGLPVIGLVLYRVVDVASFFWWLVVSIRESIGIDNRSRRRLAEHEARKPICEAQAREHRRVVTIPLTQRFIAHVVRSDHDDKVVWTLEMAHRAWRQPRTVAEERSLAESVGLSEFYTYDPYVIEMNSLDDDAVMHEYWKMLGQIDLPLQELIRAYGSDKRLADFPEFASVMGRSEQNLVQEIDLPGDNNAPTATSPRAARSDESVERLHDVMLTNEDGYASAFIPMPKYRREVEAVLRSDHAVSKLALMTDYDDVVLREELTSLISGSK